MSSPYDTLISILMEKARACDPQTVSRFFKTAPGTYGAHDQFLGLSVPMLRQTLKGAGAIALEDAARLLSSPYNEIRLFALLYLVETYKKGDEGLKDALHGFYKTHMVRVNNWNLVDASAPMLMGDPLLGKSDDLLEAYVLDTNMWVRRIGVVATWRFILKGHFGTTMRLCTDLLKDPEDLMHKACGWMLREVGKKDEKVLVAYLDDHAPHMPRTMLRYALERLSPSQKARYMSAK